MKNILILLSFFCLPLACVNAQTLSLYQSPDGTDPCAKDLLAQSLDCGNIYSYSWTPSAGLSCTTCANPIATPTITTIYTCVIEGTCGELSQTITVVGSADPGAISGPASVCMGSTISLSDGVAGGTWTSNATGVATIDASGVITPVSVGSTTISYTVTTGCGTASATYSVTVNPLPNAGTITGGSSVCMGSTLTLSDVTASGSGTWSSSATGVATVGASSGIVTPVSAGSTTITYSVTNSCGTATTTQSITVNPLPDAGTISGSSLACMGSTITLSDGIAGGTWSSSATGVATIGASSGVVTPVSVGTTTITYSVTNSCGTATTTYSVTVGAIPTGVTAGAAPSPLCTGSSITLTGSASGATSYAWAGPNSYSSTAANPSAFTVSTLSAGIYTFTATNACGSASVTATVVVDVTPNAGVISGSSDVCHNAGEADPYTSSGTAGGTWTCSPTSRATIDAATGVLTPQIFSTGSVTVSYTVTNSCGTVTATKAILTHLGPPTSITSSPSGSPLIVCSGDAVSLTATSTGTGVTYTWTASSTLTVNTADATGATATANPITSSHNYTVHSIDVYGCRGSAIIGMNVPHIVFGTAATDGVICDQGGTAHLQGGGTSTSAWYLDCSGTTTSSDLSMGSTSYVSGSGIANATLTSIGANCTGSDIVETVYFVDGGCCIPQDIHILAAPYPTLTASSTSISSGSSVTLTGGPASGASCGSPCSSIASNYHWTWSPTGPSTSAYCGSHTYTNVTTTRTVTATVTYSEPAYGTGGCTRSSDPVTITVTGGRYANPDGSITNTEDEGSGVKVYPNPNSGVFTIELENGVQSASVSITTLGGKTLISKVISDGKIQIDMSEFVKSLYILTIDVNGKLYNRKLTLE